VALRLLKVVKEARKKAETELLVNISREKNLNVSFSVVFFFFQEDTEVVLRV
jgi:hypothetical protein